MTDHELRPTDPERDLPALLAIHERAFRPLVETRYGWDPAVQLEQVQKVLGRDQAIVVDGELVGQLVVHERPGELFLERVMLDPAVQGRGLGTALIRSLMERARALGVPLTLSVWETNRARALYERLGFRITEQVEFRVKMRWEP